MISTHILDTSQGIPAQGVTVRLQMRDSLNHELWNEMGAGQTNEDGRFKFQSEVEVGVYRIIFDVENYFLREKKESFFPTVNVIFKIEDTSRHYHVPLLLNPFGYSTYRGS